MSRNRSFKTLAFLLSLALGSSAVGSAHAADASTPPAATSAASGVYYEIFVRAWSDTNGDGIGDINGVTAKLDYLKSLGISGIWLMPINTSPSYHGYDITDYYGINPQYGNEADLQHLLEEAHKRGIAVTMDMVINHTSQKHPWFIAAQNPADPHHDWYTWADAHADLNALSTASDEKIWHRLGDAHGCASATSAGCAGAADAHGCASAAVAGCAGAADTYFLGDFGGGMPDLNYDNPAVRAEMIKVGRYWIAKGVDGFRLDAAKHIYDDFKTRQHDPDVVAKNVAWWTEFHDALATINLKVTLVGEVSAESPTQLAPYLKPLGSIFDFPLAEQLIVSAKDEQVGKLDSLLKDTYAAYSSVGNVPYIDSTFLSNHDQERVMSRLGGNGDHMRMAAAMLLTLPGRPYIYYGEELGMEGRKPDPDLREPMRWQREPGAGDSHWKASSVNQGAAVSVQAEQDDPHSLLNYYRMLISWRAQVPALRDGDLQLQATGKPQLLAYWRNQGSQHVLVVHNLGSKETLWNPAETTLPKNATVLLSSKPEAKLENGRVTLPAYSTVVLH